MSVDDKEAARFDPAAFKVDPGGCYDVETFQRRVAARRKAAAALSGETRKPAVDPPEKTED